MLISREKSGAHALTAKLRKSFKSWMKMLHVNLVWGGGGVVLQLASPKLEGTQGNVAPSYQPWLTRIYKEQVARLAVPLSNKVVSGF